MTDHTSNGADKRTADVRYEAIQYRSHAKTTIVRYANGERTVIADVGGFGRHSSEDERDAALIVRDLNAHDALVEALYRALPFVEDAQNDPAYKSDAAGKVVAQIRAALTVAGVV